MMPAEQAQLLRTLENEDLDLEELMGQVIRFVPVFVTKQVRYKVTDVPTRRTIQYYLSRGLVDRPGRRGRRAVFFYRHLLQVLAVKKLQNDYLPLRKIAEITRTSSERDLENILMGERGALSPVAPSDTPPAARPPWTSWRKVRIDDHLELSVEEGFNLLDPSVDLDVINAKILNALSVLALPGPGSGAHDSSVSLPEFGPDRFPGLGAAPPVVSLEEAVVALITEGGLVPKGNPDRLESARASRFLKYSLEGIGDLAAEGFESVDVGWDTSYVNADPDRLVPLDVMREFEEEKMIGRMYHHFYTTTGVAMAVDEARRIGKSIAVDLKREGVSAAILTAT